MTNPTIHFGYEVYVDPYLVTKVKVKRGFWKRWFSLPWKPFDKYEMKNEPAKDYLFMQPNRFICHPAMKQELIEALKVQYTD